MAKLSFIYDVISIKGHWPALFLPLNKAGRFSVTSYHPFGDRVLEQDLARHIGTSVRRFSGWRSGGRLLAMT